MVNIDLKLPEEFYLEEEKCGYTIPKEMKEVWAVQLDLLQELLRVCDKHGIKVIADSGTLLGCVRHKGYIPWDDDIDLYLFRDDYDKLCSLKDEFKPGYFFQNALTDSILRCHSQLRRDDTTALIKVDYKKDYHRGIFVDIFALDYIPNDEKERTEFVNQLHKEYKKMVKPEKKYGNENDSFLKKCMKFVWNFTFLPCKMIGYKLRYKNQDAIHKAYMNWNKLASKYNHKTNYVSNITYISALKKRMLVFEESIYTDLVLMDFEMFKLYCPKDYDNRLKAEYGDYMVYKIGTSGHGETYFDVNKSYKEYDSISYKEFRQLFK